MDFKVSVIIPIYNGSQYIERCARSMFAQTFRGEMQFVFLNDGSADNSVEILKRVLSQYPDLKDRTILVDRAENKGVCYTRREGLSIAQGDYICWCDSDDWVDSDMYEKMYAATQNGYNDIVICNYIEEFADHQHYWKYKSCKTPQQALQEFSWTDFPFSLCTKMTRRSLMLDAMNFIIPTNYGEDSFASIYMLYKAETIHSLSDAFYHYDRTNECSITHALTLTWNIWKQQTENIERLARLFKPIEVYRPFFNKYKQGKKREFRQAFPNIWKYYWTYRGGSRNIKDYSDYSGLRMLYVWLVYNCFPLYWLYNRKTWNK